MKSAYLIVLAALSGAVAAVLVMSFQRPENVARTGGGSATVDLSGSMEGVEREIRLLREELANVRDAVDRASVAGPPLTSALPPAMGGDGATGVPRASETSSRRRETSTSRGAFRGGPPILIRLRELAKWEEDSDFRRRWMFRDEREVLEWFGTPDEIDVDVDYEEWEYEVPTGGLDEDGDPIHEYFTIHLHRGRMTSGQADE